MKKLFYLPAAIFFLVCITSAFRPSPRDKNLRIMSYNIRNGIGMDNKRNLDRIATVIRGQAPDIIALQEIDSATARSGKLDILDEIAKRTGYLSIFAPAILFDGGKYGIGLLSKEKPLQNWMVPLPGTEERRMLQVVEFDRFVVFNVHLSLTPEDRLKSAEMINAELAKLTKPVFLAGDFNDTPGSPAIQSLVKDRWKLISGRGLTFPADKPNTCIDYIFASQKYKVRRHIVVKASTASDHRPVVVDVKYR